MNYALYAAIVINIWIWLLAINSYSGGLQCADWGRCTLMSEGLGVR